MPAGGPPGADTERPPGSGPRPRPERALERAPNQPRPAAWLSGLGSAGPDDLPARPKQPAQSPRLESRAGVIHFKGLKLSAFQLSAVRAVEAGKNVLVSAPTGAGKTLVAEFAIADAVARGRRCIYTAPIKALSNQKYRDFRDDPAIDVGLMTGDVTIHPRAQVLIMTTEILRNSIFEDPRNLSDVEYVIFDEVHYMDDAERGTVWEESLIFAPPKIRFICLSATVANLDELGRWLGEIREQPLEIVRSDRRPVPLEFEFFCGGAGRFPARKLADVQRKTPREPSRGRRGPGGRPQREDGSDFRLLLDDLVAADLLPALVFSFSRKDCERLALQNQRRQLLDADEQLRMQTAQRELLEAFQLDPGELKGEVFRLAARGLGYHHAGMLPVHKEVIERLFTSGLIKLLFTTETFAVGINMPARTAAFFGLKKFDGQTFDYLRTRDFMQMAGRAGRQGIDAQGLVVVRLENRDLFDAPLERLLSGKPEPVQSRFRLSYSSILHLLERLGRERLHEAWEKSFNQFQHRGHNKKAREKNRLEQRRLLEAHLQLLASLGYIEPDDSLTAKGKIARLLYGYELQITELIFSGALERLPAEALGMIFVALVHETRRRFGESYVPPKLYGPQRRELDRVVGRLSGEEARHRIPNALKTFDWSLTPAVLAWMGGAPLEQLGDLSDATPGDLVRNFRMAVQLMRLTRRSLDPSYDLVERLDEAVLAMNRDEVDARRQLELG
jgi:superfamily II RNA helicase